ncbi:MAG: hypothetical protein IPI49_16800 [Myxococcales bacterium]|nr:hypothetical protein [Myxococcales bacterium]
MEEVEEAEEVKVGEGLMPFYATTFDHTPTPDEVTQKLQLFLDARPSKEVGNAILPGSGTGPTLGYKLVALTVTTGSGAFDGTGQSAQAYFTGTWLTNAASSPAYSERFVLDYPNRNDLNTGSTLVFYYTLLVGSYAQGATRDQFQRGRVGNTSADRWKCASVNVLERNYLYNERLQILNFNANVERSESGDLLAYNTSWLSYQP